MYENLLTGTIPEELYNLAKVTSFSVERNRLSGTISTSIGQLSNLEFFRVSTNDFTGMIPSEIGNLSNASKYGMVAYLTCTIEIALTPLCCRRQGCCGFTRLALQELCLKAFAFIVQCHCRFCKQTATLPRTRPFHVFVALTVAIETLESASPRRSAE
jgi:hypothetical protein